MRNENNERGDIVKEERDSRERKRETVRKENNEKGDIVREESERKEIETVRKENTASRHGERGER